MKKPLLLSSLLLGGLALTLAATPALAQTEPPPAATAPPPAASSTAFGGGAIGVGASVWTSGLTGGQFVYDQTMFHVEGLLGFVHTSAANNGPSASTFEIGASGWYHLARGINSDFSLGGGFGIDYASPAGGPSATAFVLEPGAEARVFLTPNFALTGRVTVDFRFGDNNTPTTIALGGQSTSTNAGFGFTYFFR
jgi:hypothetical protein